MIKLINKGNIKGYFSFYYKAKKFQLWPQFKNIYNGLLGLQPSWYFLYDGVSSCWFFSYLLLLRKA